MSTDPSRAWPRRRSLAVVARAFAQVMHQLDRLAIIPRGHDPRIDLARDLAVVVFVDECEQVADRIDNNDVLGRGPHGRQQQGGIEAQRGDDPTSFRPDGRAGDAAATAGSAPR